MIKNYLHYAVAAALFLASGMGNFALAQVEGVVEEVESNEPSQPNDTIGSAQRLTFTGEVKVRGSIGVKTFGLPERNDVDYYSFDAYAGNTLVIDIDEGIKVPTPECAVSPVPSGCVRSLNSAIAIFGPGSEFIDQNDDAPTPDEGSVTNRAGGTSDARLENVVIQKDGTYTVAVTSGRRLFRPVSGQWDPFIPGSTSNGTYLLIVKGVMPTVMQVKIDIKPGDNALKAPLNPKSKGNIPVALLSWKDPKDPSRDFDATKADRASIKFGPLGRPGVNGRCGKGGEDVNGDGLPDLVCHFDTQAAGFVPSDEHGIVTGMVGTTRFEGRGSLKIVPVTHED